MVLGRAALDRKTKKPQRYGKGRRVVRDVSAAHALRGHQDRPTFSSSPATFFFLSRKFSWYFRYLSFEMDIFCQGLTTRDILFQSEVKKHVASLAREELKTQPCFSYRLPPIKGGTNLGTRRIFPVVLKPARVFSITASRAPSPLPAPSFPITPPSLRFNLWKSSSLHGSVTAPPQSCSKEERATLVHSLPVPCLFLF